MKDQFSKISAMGLMVIVGLVGILFTQRMASADTTLLFNVAGMTKSSLNGAVTPQGVLFTQTAGPDNGASLYQGYLSWTSPNTNHSTYVLSKDGQPLVTSSGRLTLTSRVSGTGGITFKFGLNDSIRFTASGMTYHGESFTKQLAYDDSFIIDFSPTATVIQRNGAILTNTVNTLSGEPVQFTITGGSGIKGSAGQFNLLSLHGDSQYIAPR